MSMLSSDIWGTWGQAVRLEHQVSAYTAEQAATGWLLDQDKVKNNIAFLDDEMAAIKAEVNPQLPVHCKPYTKLPIKKAFMASGQHAKATTEWFGTKDECAAKNIEICGSYHRVEFPILNLQSDKEIKPYLLKLGWVPMEWNFSKITGKVTSPKFDDDSLDMIKNNIGKRIARHWKCNHRRSQLNGWLRDVREDGRLSSIVNPQGCPTARMTHKKIVNVPSPEKKRYFAQEMRECFIAKPGYCIVGCDAVSCQLRMLCNYMGDDDYTRTVLLGNKDDGTDIHSVNMRLAGLPTRGHAKNFIYGFLFGAGAAKVGKLIGRDDKAGKKIINQFLNGLPKLSALRDGLEKTWKKRGFLYGIDGRKIFVRKQHELLCYLLQSAEAILMKQAMVFLNDWIRAENLDARQVCIMHDEYSLEVREDHKERVMFLAEEAIRQAGIHFNLNIETAGSAESGANWYEVH